MRLQTYRDDTRSRHFDLIGGGGHSRSIDLVAVTAAGLLVMGFACAVVPVGPLTGGMYSVAPLRDSYGRRNVGPPPALLAAGPAAGCFHGARENIVQ
jgi:hypothetical protein